MDWISNLIIFVLLFGFIAIILSTRYLVERRLERRENRRLREQQARQDAESNSGL